MFHVSVAGFDNFSGMLGSCGEIQVVFGGAIGDSPMDSAVARGHIRAAWVVPHGQFGDPHWFCCSVLRLLGIHHSNITEKGIV
jgi:hypothetical protein